MHFHCVKRIVAYLREKKRDISTFPARIDAGRSMKGGALREVCRSPGKARTIEGCCHSCPGVSLTGVVIIRSKYPSVTRDRGQSKESKGNLVAVCVL